MPSIDEVGERFFCLSTKGLLPRLSVCSAILSLRPRLPLKGIQCLLGGGLIHLALKLAHSSYFPTRESIITSAHAGFANHSFNLARLERVKYCFNLYS